MEISFILRCKLPSTLSPFDAFSNQEMQNQKKKINKEINFLIWFNQQQSKMFRPNADGKIFS